MTTIDEAAAFVQAFHLTSLRLAGDGLEFTVYRAKSSRHSPPDVALRIPKSTIFSNVNDAHLSAKSLLQQELAIYALLSPSAVPVPRPFELLEIDGKTAMLSSYIESDGSHVSLKTLGHNLAKLHSVELPGHFTTIACEGTDILTVLPRRTVQRLSEFRKLDPSRPELQYTLPTDTLRSAIGKLNRFQQSLLHMDWRPANLRTREGEIVGVVDFSNALVGPAAVEIFRVLELLDPGPEFLEGYGAVVPVPNVSRVEELCLRLDAAVMIALVFLSEAPDEELGRRWSLRVRELYRALEEEV